MRVWWSTLVGALALGAVTGASAQAPTGEQYTLDGVDVAVLIHDFLTEDEVMMLRLVGQNRDALSLFVPEGDGFAALAVAPDEGFVRDGMPVESATAISGLPDLESARASALEACNAARTGGVDCQVVLEIAPR
jgi:hypothetical protein